MLVVLCPTLYNQLPTAYNLSCMRDRIMSVQPCITFELVMSQPQTANQGYEDDDYYEDENLGSMTPSISPEEAEKLATAKSIEVRSMLSRYNCCLVIFLTLEGM